MSSGINTFKIDTYHNNCLLISCKSYGLEASL